MNSYLKFLEVDSPIEKVDELLVKVAQRINALKKGGELDYLKASDFFIKLFRKGKFGRFTFDFCE